MADIKHKISQSYDKISAPYLQWVQANPSRRLEYTDYAVSQLSASASLLELGCGAGTPVTERLVKHIDAASGGRVVANDISAAQVALARGWCPDVTFHPGGMMALDFPSRSFDAVLSFYAIFHLPRVEHKGMFQRINVWLKPGGLLVCNLASKDSAETRAEFFGTEMFWSSYAEDESEAVIKFAGFEVLRCESRVAEGLKDESDPDYGVKFFWIVAQKLV